MTGMMWYCTKGIDEAAIKAALNFYEKKYGLTPEICIVPNGVEVKSDLNITISHRKYVLPKHIFLCVDDGLPF